MNGRERFPYTVMIDGTAWAMFAEYGDANRTAFDSLRNASPLCGHAEDPCAREHGLARAHTQVVEASTGRELVAYLCRRGRRAMFYADAVEMGLAHR
jgi:hypothetical protein